jgi:hypothetical protein
MPTRAQLGGWLNQPVSNASSEAFRVLFGALNLFAAARFLALGWVDRFFVAPTHYLRYWGFDWVHPLPEPWMTGAFVLLCATSACILVGFFWRPAAVVHFLVFTWVELIDVTNYLNHYYLVSLLTLVLAFLPLGRRWSLDALRRPDLVHTEVPRWVPALLRAQLSLVYLHAGLAKFTTDWLWHAQPLNLWLSARTETPLVGPWLDAWWVALAMSWGGFLFDLTIWVFLLVPRTTLPAWLVVLVFHGVTGMLFTIGLFPVIMVLGTTIFFPHDWPLRLAAQWGRARSRTGPAAATRPLPARLPGWGVVMVAGWVAFHALFPLRTHLYGGNVLWHEQGMRWSWRVMVREKNGSITYRVHSPSLGRTWYVSPSRYLTSHQEFEMSGQPDMILRLAHDLAADFRTRGWLDVQVYAETQVSLNGRPPVPLIDPGVDLAQVRPTLLRATWILPAPEGPPPRLQPVRR